VTHRLKLVVLLVVTCALGASCGSKGDPWLGTYANANGSITLDVKSGSKASITLMGQTMECPYTTKADQTLTLTCPDDPPGKVDFARQSDGSLVGPGMMGRLAKSR
jgi:hypothetical protein